MSFLFFLELTPPPPRGPLSHQGTQLRGFYTLLKEHGVGYYPAMWVDGEQILTGNVGLEAPHNRFVNSTKGAKNFQHKLYKHTDLVKPKAPTTNGTRNATNVTIAEPAFIMANRRWVGGLNPEP